MITSFPINPLTFALFTLLGLVSGLFSLALPMSEIPQWQALAVGIRFGLMVLVGLALAGLGLLAIGISARLKEVIAARLFYLAFGPLAVGQAVGWLISAVVLPDWGNATVALVPLIYAPLVTVLGRWWVK